MWSMDVCSKAWLLLSRAASSPSLREEGPSLRSGSRRLRPLPRGMGSFSHRFTTPMVQSRTELIARRNGPEDEYSSDSVASALSASSAFQHSLFFISATLSFALILWDFIIILGIFVAGATPRASANSRPTALEGSHPGLFFLR